MFDLSELLFFVIFLVISRLILVNNLVYEKLKDKKVCWLNVNFGFVELVYGF